ncbi:MAG: anthranilate phosphoribosyltransferase [Candidatus Margulisiibacteriota bacterium]
MKFSHAINRLLQCKDLTTSESTQIMNLIMGGELTPAQVAGFLVALRMKGETINEITGMAKSMLKHAVKIKPKAKDIIDTCGTGGDLSNTFNISTVSAIVAAGAGAVVAKHGNRSVSSNCGSADLLEALGVNITLTPKQVEDCINKVGIGFLFAPAFHSSMKHAIVPRRELGIRTVFNMLGPLTNPSGASRQLVGVFDEKLTGVFAQVLRNLGTKRAMIVHADDGMDEITISSPTRISEITSSGRIISYKITPEDFKLQAGSKADLICTSVKDSVKTTKMILTGKAIGSKRNAVLLNAGAAIYLSGLAKSIAKGVDMALESIESGKAMEKLEELIEFTQTVGEKKATPVAQKTVVKKKPAAKKK